MAARLRVGVADLLRTLGSRREYREQVRFDDLGVVSTRVDPDADVELEFFIEAFSGGIAVTGRVEVPWTGECRRCLDVIRGTTLQHVQEIFMEAQRPGVEDAMSGQHSPEGDEDAYPLGHDEIDLEPMVRDVVAGALPMVPLCRPDCAGPSPDRFPTGPVDESTRPADPRWGALDELTFDE